MRTPVLASEPRNTRGASKQSGVVVNAYNPSAGRRGWGQVDSWGSLTIQSSLIGEPQVPVKDCVLKNKVGVREMARQLQTLAGQT